MNKAVFLDRDGVINPLVYCTATQEYEAPHSPADFGIYTWTLKSLQLLKRLGFITILISNQPDLAKAKMTLQDMKAIEKMLFDFSEENGHLIDQFNYCYHHPNGIVPEYKQNCRCRKPGTLFVEQAIEKYDLVVRNCYFIGDQYTDIKCGNSMGMITIKIDNYHSSKKSGTEKPNFNAANLFEAALKIMELETAK
ncbi:hypothetical protein AGMMS50212_13280 [Spirochaetia bacterium]|nr:hypothetical protein AGMMS50212_13280 [Spirochaetia bacterium]